MKKLNEYIIGLLQRYENEALIIDNNYMSNSGTTRAEIENKRYKALSYYDEFSVKFG